MRIFLIGFMASGKSYLGRELARLAGFPFLDLDELIVQRSGLSITDWFAQHGEEAFRQYEAEQLRSVDAFPDLILACGGGTPCFHQNIAWMNEHGLTVFLEVPTELLWQRLAAAGNSRPLLAGLDQGDLEQYINERLSLRLPYYKQAAVIFSDSTQDAAARLCEELRAAGVL